MTLTSSPDQKKIQPFLEEEVKETLDEMKKKKVPGNDGITSDVMKIRGLQVTKYMTKVYNEVLKSKEIPICWKEAKDTLLEKKTIDGLKDAQSGNQGQEEETGAEQKQDGWMTSGKQQVHNGRGRHKIGGNGRHLQRATSCIGWTKPPNNQVQEGMK
ncbi:hypothetical protein PoB_001759500 [Plakobranchus ocellatus]|uniref:Uncharacterized protein n=1 Tax=Plakobranchus ocellatus TaxID=259542 RepID=A0AAV3Z962_9GAST|nr:hypothetical protein PoB_001759500 [Plakobranchus ocellatus]